jgi:DNA-binding response OmpR family regulator
MHTGRILIWSKDRAGEAELAEVLQLDGYRVDRAVERQQVFAAVARACGRVVLLGDLPTVADTLAVWRDLGSRARRGAVTLELPVLVRSTAAGWLCGLAAFDAGADDFQPCSGSYLVLRARLAALIARSDLAWDRDRLRSAPLQFDRARQEASFAGRALVLPVTEFELLCRLALEPERVHTQAQLLRDRLGLPGGCRASTAPSGRTPFAYARGGRGGRGSADREPPRTRLHARPARPDPRSGGLGPSPPYSRLVAVRGVGRGRGGVL